ncbi:hypothetical protein [Sorangium sp. So ce233]|uniref:hypothetical protein n=1 Tax=Sorangium sp. So ce233 TaxID=3133290 RepID=UPI003F621FD4
MLASMRRIHGVSMQRVHKALRFGGDKLGYARPIMHASFRTDGANLFVQHADRLLNASAEGQAVLRDALDASLACRVEVRQLGAASALRLATVDGQQRAAELRCGHEVPGSRRLPVGDVEGAGR